MSAGAVVAAVAGHEPDIAPGVFLAPTAVVAGWVRIGAGSSVWYGSVLRAEDAEVVLGVDCNVQDGSILHADPGFPCLLGDRVSLGHRAVVHGAGVADDVLVGMGAVVLNGARIGSWSVVAAGAVLRPGMQVPEGVLVAGVPAKVVRATTEEERALIRFTAQTYGLRSVQHAEALRPRSG